MDGNDFQVAACGNVWVKTNTQNKFIYFPKTKELNCHSFICKHLVSQILATNEDQIKIGNKLLNLLAKKLFEIFFIISANFL